MDGVFESNELCVLLENIPADIFNGYSRHDVLMADLFMRLAWNPNEISDRILVDTFSKLSPIERHSCFSLIFRLVEKKGSLQNFVHTMSLLTESGGCPTSPFENDCGDNGWARKLLLAAHILYGSGNYDEKPFHETPWNFLQQAFRLSEKAFPSRAAILDAASWGSKFVTAPVGSVFLESLFLDDESKSTNQGRKPRI